MLEGSAIINLFFTVIKLFSFRKFLMQTVEAVARRRSVEKVFLKLCKIHRKTPVPEPLFLMKLQPHPHKSLDKFYLSRSDVFLFHENEKTCSSWILS